MKDFILSRFWILLLFVTSISFAQDSDCIYGDWQIETMNETPMDGAMFGTMSFKKDNTVTITLGDSESKTEKFTIEGSDIVVVVDGRTNKATIKFCDDSTLKLYDQKGQASIVLKRIVATKQE